MECFPKSRRLLRPGEFRRVYDHGFRVGASFFTAFVLRREAGEGPRIGFSVPKALGNSVARNRIRRRMREAVRRELAATVPAYDIVFNPRKNASVAPFEELRGEVRRVLAKCVG